MCIWRWVGCVVMGMAAAARAGDGIPTAESLRAVVPCVESRDERVRSIHVRVGVDAAQKDMVLEAWYEAPGRFAGWIVDATDRTPLIVIRGGDALMYDALGQRVVYVRGVRGGFELCAEGKQLRVGLGIVPTRAATGASGAGAGVARPRVRVDLRSTLVSEEGRDELRELGGGKFELTHVSKMGGRVVVTVDPCRAGVVSGFVARDEEGRSMFRLEALEVDGAMPEGVFGPLPAPEAWAGRLRVAEVADGDPTKDMMTWAFAHAVLARRVILVPELREQWAAKYPHVRDWEALRAADARASAVVRELLGVSADKAREAASRPTQE